MVKQWKFIRIFVSNAYLVGGKVICNLEKKKINEKSTWRRRK